MPGDQRGRKCFWGVRWGGAALPYAPPNPLLYALPNPPLHALPNALLNAAGYAPRAAPGYPLG